MLCRNNGGAYRCPVCRYYYCEECFADIGEECLYCKAREEMLDMLQETQESSDEDEKNGFIMEEG